MRSLGSIAVAVITLVASLAVFPQLASAQVYKWTDDQGVVNYTSQPPRNKSASKLAEEEGRVTVVPNSREELDRALRVSQELRADRLQRERDVDRTRAMNAVAANRAAEAQTYAAWRERCRIERFVDCDDERALYWRYGTAYPVYGFAPGMVVPGRAISRPVPPIAFPPSASTPPGFGSPAPSPAAPMARLPGGPQAAAPAGGGAPRTGGGLRPMGAQ